MNSDLVVIVKKDLPGLPPHCVKQEGGVELHGVCTTALHVTSSSQCCFLNALLVQEIVVEHAFQATRFWHYIWLEEKDRALPCILRRMPDGPLSLLLLDVLVSSTINGVLPCFCTEVGC